MRVRLSQLGKNGLADLGTAQSTSEIESGLSVAGKVTTSILTEVGAATSAIPIVGTVVAGLEAIASLFHIGQGCGEACIDSASTEQIFEVAGWDVMGSATAGQITQAQAVAALQWLLSQGQAQMTELESSDSKAKAGYTNLTTTINAQIQAVQSNSVSESFFGGGSLGPQATPNVPIPTSAPTATLNPTQLEGTIFVQAGQPGWYPNSVQQGASLALQAIAAATDVEGSTPAASSGTSSLATSISSLFGGISTTTLLIIAAVGIGGIYLLTRNPPSTTNPRRNRLRRRRAH